MRHRRRGGRAALHAAAAYAACAGYVHAALLIDPLEPSLCDEGGGLRAGVPITVAAHGAALFRPFLSEAQPWGRAAWVRCAADSSAVSLAAVGPRARRCGAASLEWLTNPSGDATPLRQVESLCLRRGARPCFRDEVCPEGTPSFLDPTNDTAQDYSAVVTGDGYTVNIGGRRYAGGTCDSVSAPTEAAASSHYNYVCCARPQCTAPGAADVIIPGLSGSPAPGALRLGWRRAGRALVTCTVGGVGAGGGADSVSFEAVASPEGAGVALLPATAMLWPGQEDAELRVRLSARPSEGAKAVVECNSDAPNLVAAHWALHFTRSSWALPQRLPLHWEGATVEPNATYSVRCTIRGQHSARAAVATVATQVGAALRFVGATRRPLLRGQALRLRTDRGEVGFGIEVTAAPSAEPGPTGWAAAANLIDCALSPASSALELLRPAQREIAAGAAGRVFWFVVRRLQLQFSTYTVTVTCRQTRRPDDRTNTLWELHPDHAVAWRDIRVEPPAPETFPPAMKLTLPEGDEVPQGTNFLPVVVGIRRPGAGPAAVTCTADPPGSLILSPANGRLTFAGSAAAAAVPKPLITGDHVAFRWLGPEDAGGSTQGAQWLGCPQSLRGGSVAADPGGACRLTECGGAAFEGGEWGEILGRCAETHFRLYAAKSAADSVNPLFPRARGASVRQGDAVYLVQVGATRSDGWPLREHVGCDAGWSGLLCQGGQSCLSQLPPVNSTDWSSCTDTFRIWAPGRSVGDEVMRGDEVFLQYAPSTSYAVNRWVGCMRDSVGFNRSAEAGGSWCTASAAFDGCVGNPPDAGGDAAAAFAPPAHCGAYRWRVDAITGSDAVATLRDGADDRPWRLFHYAEEATLPRPQLGDSLLGAFRTVPPDVTSLGFAVSSSVAADLYLAPTPFATGTQVDDNAELTRGCCADHAGEHFHVRVEEAGGYALRTTELLWLSRDGVACDEDYEDFAGDVAECRLQCQNTTGCTYFSYPHLGGCRLHKGTQRSCLGPELREVNDTSATQTLLVADTPSPVSPFSFAHGDYNATQPDRRNGALVISASEDNRRWAQDVATTALGGHLRLPLPHDTTLFSAGFTYDLWLRMPPVRQRWVLQVAGGCLASGRQRPAYLDECNVTTGESTAWTAEQVPGEQVRLRAPSGSCLALSLEGALMVDCTSPDAHLQWVPHSDDGYGSGYGRLRSPAHGVCLQDSYRASANLSVSIDGVGACMWYRAVYHQQGLVPLVSNHQPQADGAGSVPVAGLFVNATGAVHMVLTDHSGETAAALIVNRPVATNQWVHIAGVRESTTDRLRLYVGGHAVAVASIAHITGYIYTHNGLWVGGGGIDAFDLVLDSVGVYDVALSPVDLSRRARCADAAHAPLIELRFDDNQLADLRGGAVVAAGPFGAVQSPASVQGVACRGYNVVPGWTCGDVDAPVSGGGAVIAPGDSAAAESCAEVCDQAGSSCAGFSYWSDARRCSFVTGLGNTSAGNDTGALCYSKGGGPLRYELSRGRGCVASSGVGNATCSGALDGVRAPAAIGTGEAAGEWASDNEGAGAWLRVDLGSSHLVDYVRVAQRAPNLQQAKSIRICFDDGACESHTLSTAGPPTLSLAFTAAWDGWFLDEVHTTRYVAIEVDSMHTEATTLNVTKCGNFICPLPLPTSATANCTDECSVSECCDGAGVGMQELQLWGRPVAEAPASEGMVGQWCADGVGRWWGEGQTRGMLGPMHAGLSGRPYERLELQECGGVVRPSWSSGTAISQGTAVWTAQECITLCDSNYYDCAGVEWQAGKCYWHGATLSPGENGSAVGLSCLAAQTSFLPASGSVVSVSTDGAAGVGNATACDFRRGALGAPHFAAVAPFTVSARAKLNDGACDDPEPIVSWSRSAWPEHGATLYLTANGTFRWRTVTEGVATVVDVTTTSTACDGSWHLVAMSLDAQGRAAFYVDGAATESACCALPPGGTDSFAVGGELRTGNVSTTFDGALHNVTVHDRAHSAVQVSARYDALAAAPTATELPGGLDYTYFRLQAVQVSGGSIATYSSQSAESCKALCTADTSCLAAEFATLRYTAATPAGSAASPTRLQCRTRSATSPLYGTAQTAGSEHIDTYIKGSSVAPDGGLCRVASIEASYDAILQTAYSSAATIADSGSALLDLTDGGGAAAVLNFDLASGGIVPENVSSAFLKLRLAPLRGLVLHYPFDDDARDASGLGNHGAASKGVGYTAGWLRGAASFNSSWCAQVVGPRADDILLTGTTSLAWSAWVRPGAADGPIITADGAFSLTLAQGHAICTVSGVGGTATAGANGPRINTTAWTHVACYWEAGSLVTYVAGSLVDTTTSTTPEQLWPAAAAVTVGCASGSYFDGDVDDVRVYADTSVSDSFVSELMLPGGACSAASSNVTVSLTTSDWTESTLRYTGQPTVLASVDRAVRRLTAGGVASVDITSLLRRAPETGWLSLMVNFSDIERNCTGGIKLVAREHDNRTASQLLVAERCGSLVGAPRRDRCGVGCWAAVSHTTGCATNGDGVEAIRSTAAVASVGDCKRLCEDEPGCLAADWSSESGKCVLFPAACTSPAHLDGGPTALRRLTDTAEVLGVPLSSGRSAVHIEFDLADALVVDPSAEVRAAVLRVELAAAPAAVRAGNCTTLSVSLRTAYGGQSDGRAAAATVSISGAGAGEVLFADVGELVRTASTQRVVLALTHAATSDGGACSADGGVLEVVSRRMEAGLAPALLLSTTGPCPGVGLRAASDSGGGARDSAQVRVSDFALDDPSIWLTVQDWAWTDNETRQAYWHRVMNRTAVSFLFNPGDRWAWEVSVAWLRLWPVSVGDGVTAGLCSHLDFSLVSGLEYDYAQTAREEVARWRVPLGALAAGEPRLWDVGGLLRQVPDGWASFGVVVAPTGCARALSSAEMAIGWGTHLHTDPDARPALVTMQGCADATAGAAVDAAWSGFGWATGKPPAPAGGLHAARLADTAHDPSSWVTVSWGLTTPADALGVAAAVLPVRDAGAAAAACSHITVALADAELPPASPKMLGATRVRGRIRAASGGVVVADVRSLLQSASRQTGRVRLQFSLEAADCGGASFPLESWFNISWGAPRPQLVVAPKRGLPSPRLRASCPLGVDKAHFNYHVVDLPGTARCTEPLAPLGSVERAFGTATGTRYLDLPPTALTASSSQDLTVSFFFIAESGDVTPAGTAGYLFHRSLLGAGFGIKVLEDGRQLGLWDGDAQANYTIASTEGASFFRRWHHYAVVRRAGGLLLYVDGERLAAVTPDVPAGLLNVSGARFGADATDSSAATVAGWFHDIRVYFSAVEGGLLQALSPGVLEELHRGRVLDFATAGRRYRPSKGHCTQNYVVVQTGGAARCREACHMLAGCLQFSLGADPRQEGEPSGCRLHDASSGAAHCSPVASGYDLYTAEEDSATAEAASDSGAVRAAWVSWSGGVLRLGQGFSPSARPLLHARNPLHFPPDTVVRQVALAQQSRYSGVVPPYPPPAGEPGRGWLYVGARQVESRVLGVRRGEEEADGATVRCAAKQAPGLAGAAVERRLTMGRAGSCRALKGHFSSRLAVFGCRRTVRYGYSSFLLKARSAGDLLLVLTSAERVTQCSAGPGKAIEIEIDRRPEMDTVVRDGMCGAVAGRRSGMLDKGGPLLSAAEAQWLWVAWGGGRLQIGRGQFAGMDSVLTAKVAIDEEPRYIHFGKRGWDTADVAVYFDARLIFSEESLHIYPGRTRAVQVGLEVPLFNVTSDVQIEVNCETIPSGIAQVDMSAFRPFRPGNEMGETAPHWVQLEPLAEGDTDLHCWVVSDVPPYFTANANSSIPVRVLAKHPIGLGLAEDVVVLPRRTTGYVHVHLGALRLLNGKRGDLLHVDSPESVLALDSKQHAWLAQNATTPTYDIAHCAMVFDGTGTGFATAVSTPMLSLSLAATVLATSGCVPHGGAGAGNAPWSGADAFDCCPIITTGDRFDLGAQATLSWCANSVLRFGTYDGEKHRGLMYTVTGTGWLDILAVKDAVSGGLLLYVDGRVVASSPSGGKGTIGGGAHGGAIIVGGGSLWQVRAETVIRLSTETCTALYTGTAAALSDCTTLGDSNSGNVVSFDPANEPACQVFSCPNDLLSRGVTEADQYAPGPVASSPWNPPVFNGTYANATAFRRHSAKGRFAGFIRRARAFSEAVGYGAAFPVSSLPLAALRSSSDCAVHSGDHDRLRGASRADLEPRGSTVVQCVVGDTSVARIANSSLQNFSVEQAAYGGVVAVVPVEWRGEGRTTLRCEVADFQINNTNWTQTLVPGPANDQTLIHALPEKGWAMLPPAPAGFLTGCAVRAPDQPPGGPGGLLLFGGNTVSRWLPAQGRWLPEGGAGVEFEGCACSVHAGAVLLYGCPHRRVLSYRAGAWVRLAGYPALDAPFQTGSPLVVGAVGPDTVGALVHDTARSAPPYVWDGGALRRLSMAGRSAQPVRQPPRGSLPGDPSVAPVIAARLYDLSDPAANRSWVYALGRKAARAEASRMQWASPSAAMDSMAWAVWHGQWGAGGTVVNLCHAAALVGGVDAGRPDPAPVVVTGRAAVLLKHTERGGVVAGPSELAPMPRGVLGGAAGALAGTLYHFGGAQRAALGARTCYYGGNGRSVGSTGAEPVWDCERLLGEQADGRYAGDQAAGYAGSLVFAFKWASASVTHFSVGLSADLCSGGTARPTDNDNTGWNPCVGYIRVVFERDLVTVFQLQSASQDVPLAQFGVWTLPEPRPFRFHWLRWRYAAGGEWELLVGRGATVGSHVLGRAVATAYHLRHAAFWYLSNGTAPRLGLPVWSAAVDLRGASTAQALTALRDFGTEVACHGRGDCDSSTGLCVCDNPARWGPRCERCTAGREGRQCTDLEPCADLHPHMPYRQAECEAWRDRGCKAVAWDVTVYVPAVNFSVRRYRLND